MKLKGISDKGIKRIVRVVGGNIYEERATFILNTEGASEEARSLAEAAVVAIKAGDIDYGLDLIYEAEKLIDAEGYGRDPVRKYVT